MVADGRKGKVIGPSEAPYNPRTLRVAVDGSDEVYFFTRLKKNYPRRIFAKRFHGNNLLFNRCFPGFDGTCHRY